MSRNRTYSSPAERQKAYRQRQAGRLGVTTQPTITNKRKLSRPKRLALMVDELQSLLTEYEDWRDSLPESLVESSQHEELEETIDLLLQALELLETVQPPLGFGRSRK